jgi:hypothetical protein
VVISHATTNAWIAKDPRKRDSVDAFKLAELLRLSRVHEVYYPDEAHRAGFNNSCNTLTTRWPSKYD